ncbi:MAG: class I SAM-dependent rRNA methyltransferase, partial [Actinobacteria bacterium]|nr:class I SAM-dependent rRNA methyltransferase [Actinomycetota bacterium]
MLNAIVSTRGARRWLAGHPWIYRSDLIERPDAAAGAVRVTDQRGKPLGIALWSPQSEISLRLLDRDADAAIDRAWWSSALRRAIARRAPLGSETNAYRLVHGEGDLLPSLVVDRYDRWLVVQLMSAGLERFRNDIVQSLVEILEPDGILARNDVPLRVKEGLGTDV